MAYIDHQKMAVKWRHVVRVGDAPCGRTEPVHQHSRAMPSLDVAVEYARLVDAFGNAAPLSAAVLREARLDMLIDDEARPVLAPLVLAPVCTEDDIRSAADIIRMRRPRADWTVYEVCVMYLAYKLDRQKRPGREAVKGYISSLANNVAGSAFGALRVADATGEDAKRWQDWVSARPGRAKGKTLSDSTVRRARVVLMDPALRWAASRGAKGEAPIIAESPMVHVDMPDAVDSERDLIRTPEEAASVLRLAAARFKAFGLLVRVLIYTGLRYNEAISLRCGDLRKVTFEDREYYLLNKEQRWNPSDGVHRGGKSTAARREVPIEADLYRELAALTDGKAWDALLLEGPTGGLWERSAYDACWDWVNARYNAEHGGQPRHWTGHALRHFYNSVIRNTGAFDAQLVSKVLGHAPRSAIAQVYTQAELSTRAAMAATPVAYIKRAERAALAAVR